MSKVCPPTAPPKNLAMFRSGICRFASPPAGTGACVRSPGSLIAPALSGEAIRGAAVTDGGGGEWQIVRIKMEEQN